MTEGSLARTSGAHQAACTAETLALGRQAGLQMRPAVPTQPTHDCLRPAPQHGERGSVGWRVCGWRAPSPHGVVLVIDQELVLVAGEGPHAEQELRQTGGRHGSAG